MKKKLLKYSSFLALIFALNFTVVNDVQAQCPMCKMSAEQNLKDGGTAGKGLNAGILYMFSAPYILVAVIGFTWYRNRRKEEDEEPNILEVSDN